MENIQEVFGKKLQHLRKQKNLTQEEVSGRSGLSIQFVGEIERGKRNPSLSSVKKIASALDVAVADVFDIEEFQLTTEELREKLLEQVKTVDDEKLYTLHSIYNLICK